MRLRCSVTAARPHRLSARPSLRWFASWRTTRGLLKKELLSGDENDLFKIANTFNLRHKNPSQQGDYRQEFLEWLFYTYLATIQLTTRLRRSQEE